MNKKYIMIFAGEVSGENHAAFLINSIKKKDKNVEISGIGGGKMLGSEFNSLGTITGLNSFQLSFIKRIFLKRKIDKYIKKVEEYVKINKPSVFVFVGIADDTQYFVKKLLKLAEINNIKTMYYFSPHVWLWSKKKTKKVAHEVDCIFTFFKKENEEYLKAGANTEFIGHPVVDELPKTLPKTNIIKKYNIPQNSIIVSLVHGSRKAEIKIHSSLLYKLCKKYKQQDNVFFISTVTTDKLKKSLLNKFKDLSNHKFIENSKEYYEVISNADISVTCSGTATLEVALYQTPQIIFYKLPKVDYLFWRVYCFFTGIKELVIGMPNIIAGEKIIPELLQGKANVNNMEKELLFLFKNKEHQPAELKKLKENNLNKTGTIDKAGEIIVEYANI